MRKLGLADARGSTTVELALVVPILMLLIVGLLDFARAMNASVVVGSASREAAHYAILHPSTAPSDIETAARARTAPLDPASVTVVARYYDSVTATFVAWPETGIPPNSPSRGVLVRIEVSYPWSAVSFVAGQYFSATGTRTLSARSTMETRR